LPDRARSGDQPEAGIIRDLSGEHAYAEHDDERRPARNVFRRPGQGLRGRSGYSKWRP
jgi:hypothetical protein